MYKEKIENILNAQPIKYYPNKEDAQRVLRERNAKLAKQISQLFEQVKRDIFNKTVHAAEHRERFMIEQTRQETDAISYTKGVLDGIKKGRQETAREIFDTIETGGYGIPYILTETSKKDWQALKARYGVK